jgi:hypothetical protein
LAAGDPRPELETADGVGGRLRVVELPKLCNSQAAMTAAYRASMILIEQGWMRYPAARWDQPAIAVMDGATCVAGVSFSEDRDERAFSVDFAFSDPAHPVAFTLLLQRIRSKVVGGDFDEVRFACHEGNEPMRRAVNILGARVFSHSYRMPVAALSRSSRPPPPVAQRSAPGEWDVRGEADQRNKRGWK